MQGLDVRADFLVLQQQIKGGKLAYLDSSATTHPPQAVIDAMVHYYQHDHSNIHRGIYTLSERASSLYEKARVKVAGFIGAGAKEEIIFTSGTTESINMVACSYAQKHLKAGDEIIISGMEHHSNFIPWQVLAKEIGAELKIVPVRSDGTLDFDMYVDMLSERTKFIALAHVSNVLGTVNPLKKMIGEAKKYNVPVLVDGAQAVAHLPVNVQDLDCDFYAFSAHKIYGPTGVGVLYAKAARLEQMGSYKYGGGTVFDVSESDVGFLPAPSKFEAGTPNIVGVVGLKAALDYVGSIGIENIMRHERELLEYLKTKLSGIAGVKIFGPSDIGVVAFSVEGIHPHDLASLLDEKGVAIRAGTHCAMPLLKSLGLGAIARASLGVYSNKNDVDALIGALKYACEVFAV